MGPVSIARRLAALVAIASVTCAIACASPTLPLPPPGIPSITDQGVPAGEVQLSSVSGAEPNALVLVYNQNPSLSDTERGALTQADGTGSWTAVVHGSTGDYLEIQQVIGTELSTATVVQIPMF